MKTKLKYDTSSRRKLYAKSECQHFFPIPKCARIVTIFVVLREKVFSLSWLYMFLSILLYGGFGTF